ncbi:hypothetical protein JOF41_005431 [Saccharothrix coeruleofusca]|uniref:type IV toxin-antitoxin system AbiEi family antitoxin domain-containing protein n=1 Tax=Saccharothrix coeruleofusca TaxID=33919 RepID=UPI001AE6EEE2|nr:type IV toxin-antitoxin system AbiEi family antitoxin domain-containing protein [Saccharothrix coeruleofusca]MBP2339253.1 hypothetical protein [Saccharothrix coeruleofusca]
MERVRALQVVGDIASDQWGLFTTAQAEAEGVDRTTLTRLASAGLIEQVSRGVHLVVAAGTPTNLEERAAWLRLSPARRARERRATDEDNGVFSHRTACLLHELGDVPAPQVEITVPRRRTTRITGIRLHRAELAADEITTTRDGLPVTTVERTIEDLLADQVDGGHLGGVLADALRRHLVDPDRLAATAAIYAPAYGLALGSGRRLVQHLLDQPNIGTEHAPPVQAKGEATATVHAIASQLAGMDPDQLEMMKKAVELAITAPNENQSETEFG